MKLSLVAGDVTRRTLFVRQNHYEMTRVVRYRLSFIQRPKKKKTDIVEPFLTVNEGKLQVVYN